MVTAKEAYDKGVKDGFNPDDSLSWIWGACSDDDAVEQAYLDGVKMGQRLAEEKDEYLTLADKHPNKLEFWQDKARELNQFIGSCSLQDNGDEAEAWVPLHEFCEKQVQHYK